MIRVKSLQQRFVLLLLLPVAGLLVGMGIVGFIYARTSLLTQWQEAAILKLERAGKDVDMRLSRFKEWLEMYYKTGGEHHEEHVQQWILDQLRELDGVERVSLIALTESPGGNTLHLHRGQGVGTGSRQHMMRGGTDMMHFHRARIAEITPPRYDSLVEHETVSIISELNDANGVTVGRLEVAIRFDYLVANIGVAGWWQSNRAFLLDDTGRILVGTHPNRRYLGENDDALESATLEAMKKEPSGTVLGEGHPPDEVSGFYKLQEAPWAIVLVAPGKEILAPIMQFRTYYAVTGSLFILFVILLIRLVTGRMVSSIKNVSSAAEKVARGRYDLLPAAKSEDEVGQLIHAFNTMVSQLQERMQLKQALGLAMEVQQSLFPRKAPNFEGFDIAGKSIYCDETGGDYYDFLEFSHLGNGRIGVAVGDVAGHGISAALLMTTVRALVRSRATRRGTLAQMVTDVNRLLCADTSETGNFMTLFLMLIDSENKELRWVRAGHEPAIVYDPATNSFTELRGDGVALGVDASWSFQEHIAEGCPDGQTILIGTDGIWEAENPRAELFGKESLREIIRQHTQCSSQEILEAIFDALSVFRQTLPQKDDITMVVVKKVPEGIS
ncbi:MAG: SpoIIE family protein phosphatase [Deltaproteobacteria bacterium]|nr:MAG: SpoIIE family protein phosphatase [Deltaproteobacteria bacterium]